MTMFNVEAIRADFPILNRQVNGKPLVYFAGYKNHIGLYPGSKAIEILADDLKGYRTSKGTIQFPIEKPLPMALIKSISKTSIASTSLNLIFSIKNHKFFHDILQTSFLIYLYHFFQFFFF